MKNNKLLKILTLCLLVVTMLLCTLFAGCGGDAKDQESQNLQYNKKYFQVTYNDGVYDTFYEFYSDGTGKKVEGDGIVYFVYFYDSKLETFNAFYDSKEGNTVDVSSSWKLTFNVTKYGLVYPYSSSGHVCLLEEYLDKIPNYNK